MHLIDYENGLIELDGKTYELLDKNFPTIDPKRPYALTEAEEEVLDRLTQAFVNCEKLQSHMHFLLSKVDYTKYTITTCCITGVFR